MKLLFFGDIVGQMGRDFLQEKLPGLKRYYQADVVVANGENSAEGNGILPASARQLFDSGVDVITTGNHALQRREIYDLLEERQGVIRPANFHPSAPGAGVYTLDMLRYQLCVINLQGVSYLEPNRNPFDTIDEILAKVDTPNILVDFHAEATAEKLALGYYLDGRVSAVFGTHTHVQTADERIMPKGTAYITDAGMCGGFHSALGVRIDLSIQRFRTGLPTRFENAKETPVLWGVFTEIDERTGRAQAIERVDIRG